MRLLIAEYDKNGEHMNGNKTMIIERDKYTRTEIRFVQTHDGYTCHMTEAQMMLLINIHPLANNKKDI